MLKESELTQTPAKKNKKGPPMITFKGKKYAISEETAISWLKSVHFQLAKPLAEKMGLELPSDFVSDNEGKRPGDFGSQTYEEALKKGEEYIAMRIKWATRKKARRACSLKQEYVYIVTSYERGDDYSAFAYAAIDKNDAVSFVEKEQKKCYKTQKPSIKKNYLRDILSCCTRECPLLSKLKKKGEATLNFLL